MTDKKDNYHVVPHEGGWAVRRDNAERVSSQHDTQADAIDAGRDLAEKARSDLRIHGRDGKIRDSDSYGGDPCPPRDQKH